MKIRTFTVEGMLALAVTTIVLSACHEPVQTQANSMPPTSGSTLDKVSAPPLTVANTLHALSTANASLPLRPAHGCNIERVDRESYAALVSGTRGESIVLSGWVINPLKQSVPNDAVLRVENLVGPFAAWSTQLDPHIMRSDVAQAEGGNAAYLRSGFAITLSTTGLPAGNYHLFIQYNANGKTYACDNGRKLQLMP